MTTDHNTPTATPAPSNSNMALPLISDSSTPHKVGAAKKPRKRISTEIFCALVLHLARCYGLSPEVIVTMTPADLEDLITEANASLFGDHLAQQGERMLHTGRAFPARRGKGTLTAAMLRSTIKRHLAAQGLTLESIGWVEPRKVSKASAKRPWSVSPNGSAEDVRSALAALISASPAVATAPAATEFEVI